MKSAVIGLLVMGIVTGFGEDLGKVLGARVLPAGSGTASYTDVFNELAVKDIAADEAWLALKDRAAYDAYRQVMRDKMIAALGGFPEKTSLNARVTGVVEGDGYRVEKVIFESLPGVYVTGNLFLPTDASFKAPFPVVLITCGHSFNGKGSEVYQRGCVQAAKKGIAAFIYDPIDQGERLQSPDGKLRVCNGHNAIGVRAAMLGWNTARFRIWDGIRAIDYVSGRADIAPDKIGYMGQSGGGTMTSLMMSVEPRIRAAAPSCYLTNLRALCAHMGPQDAEQNIFGQLSFGLNHAGYILLQHLPVSVTCTFDDMFPYYGTRESYRVAERVYAMLGDSAMLSRADAVGPHGWKESTRAASVAWMEKWLKGGVGYDMVAMRKLDFDFNSKACDMGLKEPASFASEGGDVRKMPGFRSVYDVMREEAATCAAARKAKGHGARDLSAMVKRLAKIRMPGETGVEVKVVKRETLPSGMNVERVVFAYPSGLGLPCVLVTPVKVTASPVLMTGDKGRAALATAAEAALSAGHPVMVADVTSCGEIGAMKYDFYDAKADADEGTALMLYLLGDSLVGRRATDLLEMGAWLKARLGGKVLLEAYGKMAIPAAHASQAAREIFAGVSVHEAPESWSAAMSGYGRYPYANIVNGALREYDWTDLLN